jgi:methyl-accepting chemotaxis protein
MAILALLVVSAVVWVVYRTVERAQDSNEWVVHTQEVLKAIEATLAEVVDAESVVRSYLASADTQALEPLNRAERAIGTDVSHLATLTVDNPNQQARVPQLRQDATRALAALRAQAHTKRGARAARTVSDAPRNSTNIVILRDAH